LTSSCIGVGINAENKRLTSFDALSEEADQVIVELFYGIFVLVFKIQKVALLAPD
jgi:hypothetical protein